VGVADILSSCKQHLHGAQLQVWTKAVQDVGLDLDPYTCKASYVCGMLRQFIEAAGLQLLKEYHVGALVSAASATELLGWCYIGATNSKEQPSKRLGNGVQYLEQVGPPYLGPVRHPAAEIAGWVRSVRNFGAHGAAYGKHLTLDRMLTVWLLRSLAQALDVFWTDDGDQRRHQNFSRATITPLYTNGKPIFVHEVRDHLAKGLMPGAKLDYEASWRSRQSWEDQAPPGAAWRFIPITSPPTTGTG
jgi:hypothetical protein